MYLIYWKVIEVVNFCVFIHPLIISVFRSEEFDELLDELNLPDRDPLISKEILSETREETQMFLRQREHLIQYSHMSNFVIM